MFVYNVSLKAELSSALVPGHRHLLVATFDDRPEIWVVARWHSRYGLHDEYKEIARGSRRAVFAVARKEVEIIRRHDPWSPFKLARYNWLDYRLCAKVYTSTPLEQDPPEVR